MFLRQVKRFGGQAARVELGAPRARMPQRSQAVVDDERHELRSARIQCTSKCRIGNLRTGYKQRSTVIIKPRHVVILADS